MISDEIFKFPEDEMPTKTLAHELAHKMLCEMGYSNVGEYTAIQEKIATKYADLVGLIKGQEPENRESVIQSSYYQQILKEIEELMEELKKKEEEEK